MVSRPWRAQVDIWTQKLLRACSPVMPRVRAMSRARRGRVGVWRRMATMVGHRLGGRAVEGGLAGVG